MVTTIKNPDATQDALLITPYAPLSWRASLFLLFLVSTPIIGVAIVSGLLGNWYVLPVSSTLCIFIGLAFRSAYRRTQIREVVLLDDRTLSIARGHRQIESRVSLPRACAAVLWQASPRGAEDHLYICANEQKVEIGNFLDDKERHELADRLAELIRSARSREPLPVA